MFVLLSFFLTPSVPLDNVQEFEQILINGWYSWEWGLGFAAIIAFIANAYFYLQLDHPRKNNSHSWSKYVIWWPMGIMFLLNFMIVLLTLLRHYGDTHIGFLLQDGFHSLMFALYEAVIAFVFTFIFRQFATNTRLTPRL